MTLRKDRLTDYEDLIFDGDDEIGTLCRQPIEGGFLFAYWPLRASWTQVDGFEAAPRNAPVQPIHITATNVRTAMARLSRLPRVRLA